MGLTLTSTSKDEITLAFVIDSEMAQNKNEDN